MEVQCPKGEMFVHHKEIGRRVLLLFFPLCLLAFCSVEVVAFCFASFLFFSNVGEIVRDLGIVHVALASAQGGNGRVLRTYSSRKRQNFVCEDDNSDNAPQQ